jgi:hypothetical protein
MQFYFFKTTTKENCKKITLHPHKKKNKEKNSRKFLYIYIVLCVAPYCKELEA